MKGKNNMKKLCIIMALSMLSVTACSQTVSKEEYESVVAEKEALESSAAAEKLDRVNKELNDSKPLTAVQSWAETAFGSCSTFASSDNQYIQCVVLSKKDSTADSVKTIQDSMVSAWRLLPTILTTYDIPYQYLYIRFLNQDNTPLIEYVFTKSNGSYDLTTFTIDPAHPEILQYLINTNKN